MSDDLRPTAITLSSALRPTLNCLLLTLDAASCSYESSYGDQVRKGLREKDVDGEICYMIASAFSTNTEEGRIGYVYIRKSSTDDVKRPPVLYLAVEPGLPGSRMIEGARPLSMTVRQILELTDFIILDQPGVGLSTPRLECKNSIAAEDERATTRFYYAKLYAVAAIKYREGLIEKGFEIDNFRSENFA